jgi:hypothetical protein
LGNFGGPIPQIFSASNSARLHFPVSGISISRTLFFVPARIPQDSFGFLFFPEEFFHRNLLLAGVRKFLFSAMFTGNWVNSCI